MILSYKIYTRYTQDKHKLYTKTTCTQHIIMKMWLLDRRDTHMTSWVFDYLVPLLVLSPQVNEIDFQDSIMVLGFSEELNKELLSVS